MIRKLTALLVLNLILTSAGWGQVPNLPKTPSKEGIDQLPAEKTPTGPHELTPQDLEAFLDGIVPLQLEHDDIGGAIVTVVKNGKVLFAKGYGYSDYEKKKRVSPEETLFRPGSVSKLFTWTAVMQLFEQGKLDLDRDV